MTSRSLALARGVAVIGGTTAIIVGITFAALTSNTVTFSSNTISTTNAALKIVKPNGNLVTSLAGFTTSSLVPGTPSSPAVFDLANTGTTNLGITATIPSAPTVTGVSGGNGGADNVDITITDWTGASQTFTLSALESGSVSISSNALPAGATGSSSSTSTPGDYTYSVNIPETSVTGSSASVSSFDLVLTGTQTP